MKPTRTVLLAMAACLVGASLVPAHAAPPTAMPSPGYDARLQEQRTSTRVYAPVTKPVPPRRAKRTPN